MRIVCSLLLLSVLFTSGCRIIGDRSVSMLSPEEQDLISDHREKKSGLPSRYTRNRGFVETIGLGPTKEGEKVWDWKWSWDRGVATPGKPSADNPEYDADGNLIVSPEVVRTYQIPDIHAGLAYDVTEDKIRSLIEVEAFEVKVPRARWIAVGVTAGEDYLGGHISKRWTSIFEIETGLFFGHDFEADKSTWGLGGLIIKF